MKKIRDSKRTRQLLCGENVTPRPINVATEEINIPSTTSSASPPHQDVREEVAASSSSSSATPLPFRDDVRVEVASTSSTYLQIEDGVPKQRESLHTPTLLQGPQKKLQFKVKNFFNDIINFKHVDIFNCRNENLEIVSEYRQGFRSVECGLFVDAENPYLAATPDGLIGDNGIIEVKCPYSAAKTTPIDAIQKQIIKFAELREGRMFLKRSSNYFYQVQGQLHITQRRYCIFIVWGHLLELSLKLYFEMTTSGTKKCVSI
ncbi:uncharacterized protein LOC130891643 [Diorhabda carinulata]|uniref:uncharacterized protein LOC130891643 n=1 Tax=Diorhabda carinulata TaxID=1163345 RepID=UPI0025A2809D|nr:uncharacterized protein LOC130891643 [Diorhabda carinulata]